MTNAREVAQLTETLKQKVQAKAQRIRRYGKRETQYSQNKMFKEDTKKLYRKLGMKNIEAREPTSMAEAQTYWKSLWVEDAQHNERGEWIRREQKRKIIHMDWKPIQIMEITSYLSKAHNWKSPGNDQIQNYWLKAFPATHRHITKNFNAITEEPQKVPDWLTTGITYLIPKNRTQQGSQKLPTHYMLNDHVQKPNRNNSQKNLHAFGKAALTTSRANRMSPWK